ncbi:hypothetical protein K474DRAFT_1651758, partial [Panus rudis PR-1116 ss-1]
MNVELEDTAADLHLLKRPRYEEPGLRGTGYLDPEPAKEAKLWFDDGSVYLIAEGKPFLVHRSILSYHSLVFHDTFKIPQPQTVVDHINGIPVVQLSDLWNVVKYFLTAIYYVQEYLHPDVTRPFSEVSALLHLATKYQADSIRKEAIRRLIIWFPSNLKEFARSPAIRWTEELDEFDVQDLELSGVHKWDAIAAVNLARSMDVPEILPPAFYVCANLPIETLFKGHTDKNGRLHRLSVDDVKLCLSGKEKLSQ